MKGKRRLTYLGTCMPIFEHSLGITDWSVYYISCCLHAQGGWGLITQRTSEVSVRLRRKRRSPDATKQSCQSHWHLNLPAC